MFRFAHRREIVANGHRPRIALLSNLWQLPRMVGYNRYALSLLPAMQRQLSAEWYLCALDAGGVHPLFRDRLQGEVYLLRSRGDPLSTQWAFCRAQWRLRPRLWHVLTDEPVPLAVRTPVVVTCTSLPRWLRFRHLLADGKVPGRFWDYQDFANSPLSRKAMHRQGILIRAYWGRADAIIAISDYVRWELTEKLGIPRSRITVVHLAADSIFEREAPVTAVTQARARYGLPARYVLAVASFSRVKNTAGLLALAAALRREAAAARLVLIGAAGCREIYARAAEDSGLAPGRDVWFLENIPDEDLALLYRGAELFVNLAWEESFALPVVEAMVSGVPVVAAQTTALPEIVGDGGVLVDPCDPAAVTRTVRALLASPEARAELSVRALRRGRQFSWDRAARETLAVYRRVLTRAEA